MSEPEAGHRKIAHFEVTVDAYDQLTQLLGNMPYKHAAAPLQLLTEGSRAIFEREPEVPEGGAGQIVDNPPEHEDRGHLLVFASDQRAYQCRYCNDFVEINTLPLRECPNAEPELDNKSEGEE